MAHYREYINLSITELSKKYKKQELHNIWFKYDSEQARLHYKLKKPEIVNKVYEILHPEDETELGRIAKIHFKEDKYLEKQAQQKLELQKKKIEYNNKIDEIIDQIESDDEFKHLIFQRLKPIILDNIYWTPHFHVDLKW
jgi:hypothetical protein